MSSYHSIDQKRNAVLLARIPEGTKYIQVRSETGQMKYKPPGELAATDEIQADKTGEPIVMRIRPGRPKIITIEPITPIVAELVRRKAAALNNDPILATARHDPESPDVLQQVVLALGEEVASIAFERQEAERRGEDTSSLSTKRIAALKALADTWLKRKDQVQTRGVDLNSPAFKALLKLLLETMREAMGICGVIDDMVETVFARLAKMMDGSWENEAKNRMKNVV